MATCPALASPTKGTFEYLYPPDSEADKIGINTKVKLHCPIGHTVEPVTGAPVCQSDGKWSTKPPYCKRKFFYEYNTRYMYFSLGVNHPVIPVGKIGCYQVPA
jgi:hypothetical protein